MQEIDTYVNNSKLVVTIGTTCFNLKNWEFFLWDIMPCRLVNILEVITILRSVCDRQLTWYSISEEKKFKFCIKRFNMLVLQNNVQYFFS